MGKTTKYALVVGIIQGTLGIMASYFFIRALSYPPDSPEARYWAFLANNIVLIILINLPIAYLIDRFILNPKLDKYKIKDKSKEKKQLRAIDYIIFFLLLGGIISFAITLYTFIYMLYFIPYGTFEEISVFNIPLTLIFQVVLIIESSMMLTGAILIFIFWTEKPNSQKPKEKVRDSSIITKNKSQNHKINRKTCFLFVCCLVLTINIISIILFSFVFELVFLIGSGIFLLILGILISKHQKGNKDDYLHELFVLLSILGFIVLISCAIIVTITTTLIFILGWLFIDFLLRVGMLFFIVGVTMLMADKNETR